MPRDAATQHMLGLFRGLPAWWKKRQGELAARVLPPSLQVGGELQGGGGDHGDGRDGRDGDGRGGMRVLGAPLWRREIEDRAGEQQLLFQREREREREHGRDRLGYDGAGVGSVHEMARCRPSDAPAGLRERGSGIWAESVPALSRYGVNGCGTAAAAAIQAAENGARWPWEQPQQSQGQSGAGTGAGAPGFGSACSFGWSPFLFFLSLWLTPYS